MLKVMKSNQAGMKKPRRSVTLSKETVDWINQQIEQRRFKDFSHAVEYAVWHLKDEMDKQKT